MSNKTKFGTWIDTFLEEKGIDLEHSFTVESEISGTNFIPLGCVVEEMKNANPEEQGRIKTIIVKIDFMNGDVLHFFRHLAQAVVAVADRQASTN